MGAGGMLCATLEVVKRGIEKTGIQDLGCEIYLDKEYQQNMIWNLIIF